MSIISTLYTLPASVTFNGVGTAGWVNPDYILQYDGDFATASGITQEMTVGNFSFANPDGTFGIPQGSDILNFTVRLKGYRGSWDTSLNLYAVDDTSGVAFAYPYLPVFQGFDGTNTLWTLTPTLFGTTWTVDQANNIKFKLIADGEIHMDAMDVSVDYEDNVTPIPPVNPDDGEVVCGEFVQTAPFQAARAFTGTDLFLFLTSMNYSRPNGSIIEPVQIGDFYGEAILVIDQGKSNEETFEISNIEHNYQGTGLARLTITAITDRGLMPKWPYTHDVTRVYNHSGTAEVVVSNSARFYDRFLKKCQIDALVSAPISTFDEGILINDHTHGYNYTGNGVSVIPNPGDPDIMDVIIPGTGTGTPIPVDVSTGGTGGTPAISATWMHTSSGTDRGILVQISTEASKSVNSVTYNGINLAPLITGIRANVREEQWFLVAPPVGTYPIVITMSAIASITAGAETYNNLNQTAPIGATQSADGSSLTPSLILNTTVDNSLVVDGLATQVLPIAYTVGPGQSENWKTTVNPNIAQGASSLEQAGSTPDAVTMDSNITQSTNWVLTAVELCGFSGSGPTTDEKVKATSADLVPGYLDQKLQAGANITLTVINPGANEKIEIASTGGGGGGGNNLLVDQTPLGTGSTYGLLAGAVDGVNTTFTVSAGSYVTGSLVVEVNGLVQLQGSGDEFVETTPGSGIFDFVTAPTIGDIITVQYQSTGGGVGAQSGIQFEDQGVALGTPGTVDEVDFIGTGVTATRVGNKVTVNVPGGGGSGATVVVTAEEDLAAGDAVGYATNMADACMKAVWAYRDQIEGSIVRSVRTSRAVCEIDTNKYVIMGENFPPGSSRMKAVIISLNDDMTWTIGAPSANMPGFNSSMSDVVKLDTDKFLYGTIRDEVNPYIVDVTVCTVSGTTVTVENTDSFFEPSTDNASAIDFAPLDTDRVAMLITGTNVSTHCDLFEVTVSGITPTIGTQVIVQNTSQRLGLIEKIDTNKVAIVFAGNVRSATVSAGVWTVNAPTAMPSSVQFSSQVRCGLISITPNNIFVTGYQAGSVYVFNYDLTGSGAPTLVASASYAEAGTYMNALATDGTDVYLATQSTNLLLSGFARLTISGATILIDEFAGNFDMADIYTPGGEDPFFQNNIIVLGNLSRYCMFGLTDVSILADEIEIRYHIQGMTPNYIGMAQAITLRGAPATITINGVDTNQTGIVPGTLYEPFEGGILPTVDLSKPWLLQAQSATDIKVN